MKFYGTPSSFMKKIIGGKTMNKFLQERVQHDADKCVLINQSIRVLQCYTGYRLSVAVRHTFWYTSSLGVNIFKGWKIKRRLQLPF
jgi:hypothetical protein